MSRSIRIFSFVAVILCMVSTRLHAQAVQEPKLFVHFDKTVYTNNEVAWFTGYLLGLNAADAEKHEVLSVALIRDADSTVIKQDKYLLEKGLAMGCMLLPDSLLAGNYHFLATTNRVRKGIPDVFFLQSILIKTDLDPAFNASIQFMEQQKSGQPYQLLLAVTTKDARFLPKPVDVTYRYGNLYKKTKTNVSGELLFPIKEQPNLTDPNLYAKLSFGKDSSFVNIPIPVSVRRASVHFYPEGGHLVDQIPGTVAWEVNDQQGATVTVKAQLYENDVIIDTIETNAYGIGKFQINPLKHAVYGVRLMHSGFADSLYRLPAILAEGIRMSVPKAAAQDTLRILLKASVPQKLIVQISDSHQQYPGTEIQITRITMALRLSLSQIAKGLHTITISDSLGRPLAERMFFAHYDPAESIHIDIDKPVYVQREKVTLKLNLQGADTLGLVSIACVQDNRISSAMGTDIESYTWLSSELGKLPLAVTGRGYANDDYVENILLTKGWRKYTWQDLNQDTVQKYDSLRVKIAVKRSGKKLKKPISVSYFNDRGVGILSTDQEGELLMDNAELLTPYGKKLHLLLGDASSPDYTIQVEDPYQKNNERYARLFETEQRALPSAVQNNRVLALNNKERINRLQEVVIKTGKDQNINFLSRLPGTNACGDYVCTSNILNCPNHFGASGNTQPINGKIYRNPGMQSSSPYHGCTIVTRKVNMISLDPIYTQKAYYVNEFSDPQETALVSTIYWSHAQVLTPKTKEISFYTSDITGKFRVIVQGISDTDVLFGQQYFEVRTK